MDEKGDKADLTDLRLSALLACAAIVLGFVVYWWGEIESVRELLDMAYG